MESQGVGSSWYYLWFSRRWWRYIADHSGFRFLSNVMNIKYDVDCLSYGKQQLHQILIGPFFAVRKTLFRQKSQYFWGDLPCCFSGLLILVGEVNSYMVCNRKDVMIPASPSVRSDFGLAVTVGRAWNLVPAEIRQSRTFGSFKRQMKSFLLNVSYGLFIIFFSFLGCCFVGVVSSMTREF